MNKIILDFVQAINSADVEKICDLMTKDHLFIDSQDNRVTGKEKMKEAWKGYFALFPDYKIEINEVLEKNSLICLLGYASGTYNSLKNTNNHWRIPAAWTARVIDNKISVWQVYADNSIVLEIMNRGKSRV